MATVFGKVDEFERRMDAVRRTPGTFLRCKRHNRRRQEESGAIVGRGSVNLRSFKEPCVASKAR